MSTTTTDLQSPDKHYVSAAQGWLNLGSIDDAEKELSNVGYWSRLHPDVLMVRWKIVSRQKQWERSLDVARTMIRSANDRPSGYVCLAYSLCHLERDEDAKAQLIEAHQKFPKVTAIPYFLARLTTKLGQMQEASDWLKVWSKLIDKPEQEMTARRDPKLKSLWAFLGEDVGDQKENNEVKTKRDWSEVKVASFVSSDKNNAKENDSGSDSSR